MVDMGFKLPTLYLHVTPYVAPEPLCDGCGAVLPTDHHHTIVGFHSDRIHSTLNRRFCSKECRTADWIKGGSDADILIHHPHTEGQDTCSDELCECKLKQPCRCDPTDHTITCQDCDQTTGLRSVPVMSESTPSVQVLDPDGFPMRKLEKCPCDGKPVQCHMCHGTGQMSYGPLFFCSHDPAHEERHLPRYDKDIVVTVFEWSHGDGMLQIGPPSKANHPKFLREQYKFLCPCDFKKWFEEPITQEHHDNVRAEFQDLLNLAIKRAQAR